MQRKYSLVIGEVRDLAEILSGLSTLVTPPKHTFDSMNIIVSMTYVEGSIKRNVVDVMKTVNLLKINSEDLIGMVKISYSCILLRIIMLEHISWKMKIYESIENGCLYDFELIDESNAIQSSDDFLSESMFDGFGLYKDFELLNSSLVLYAGKALKSFYNKDNCKAIYYIGKMEEASMLVMKTLNELDFEITHQSN
jgi:hypothetical protein